MEEIELGTIEQACRVVGGDESPIDKSTYYRGVKAGIYTPPTRVSANISRVNLRDLRRRLRGMIEAAE